MTIEEAKLLKRGDILNPHPDHLSSFRNNGKNKDGTPIRMKVTSVKTWKSDPNRIRIGLQRGLYEKFSIGPMFVKEFIKVWT